MTMPGFTGGPPKDVLTVGNLGDSTQNLNPTKVKGTAQDRMSDNFLSSAGGLTSGLATTATNVYGNFIGKIVDDADPTTVESPEDVSSQVQSFFSNPGSKLLDRVTDFLSPVLQGITDGLSGAAEFVAGLFALRWAQVDSHETSITEHTEAITRLEDVAATFTVTPAYIADIQDMASGARANLVGWDSDGGRYFPTFKPEVAKAVFGPYKGRVYYTPIIVDRRGTVDKLRWVVGSDSNFLAIDGYRMALMVYNPANGNLEKVWDSGDIKDGAASGTSLRETWISMGINQPCIPGQLLFVAHQQIAPGVVQFTRGFGAILQAGVGRTSDLLLDAASYMSPGATQDQPTGIPSSTSLASLTRNNSMIPWAAVSVIPESGAP